MSSVDDLTQLKQLNETTMVECLGERYASGSIYTFTGPVLLAVNPFANIPHLYSMDKVKISQQGHRAPHIFTIAQAAYDGIIGSILDQRSHKFTNQSILISGESGAGKTETSKLVMKYLSLCGHSDQHVQPSGIERKILETNPLLEAFGNAKTLRNDNSSRFGKFIQLQFRSPKPGTLKLAGARIETYLLEKVRVCSQSNGERSFHIFYQCCAAAAAVGGTVYDFPQQISSDEQFRLKLNGFTDACYFSYLNGSGSTNTDDLIDFERTIEALRVLGLSVRDIEELLSAVAAVLHIGNIEFEDKHDTAGGEGCVVASVEALYMSCALLGISDPEILQTALCTRGISVSAAEEGFRSPLSAAKAADVRDAFARFVYHSVFSFLVDVVNSTIQCDEADCGPFVGLLDIFGFEYFEINCFEQLCINYANERLQHLFVDHVLRAEQAVYEAEGIPWSRLDFPDNEGVLNLLHHPLTGILPMLDEECRIVGGNDANYLAKLAKANSDKGEYFSTIRTKKDWFIVNHFAGSVAYKVSSGFVDKNRDGLSMDVVELVNESSTLGKICAACIDRFASNRSGGNKVLRSKIYTVSSEFRGQLSSLMELISETRPLFVRCIKPNHENLAAHFDSRLVLDQLRYGGVLQAVEISRAGFPIRIDHSEFFSLFGFIVGRRPADVVRKFAGQAVLGSTKVFIKQAVWDQLMDHRQRVRNAAAIKVQSFFKMAIARIEFITVRRVLVSVQSVIRSAMVLRFVNRNRAAAKIQATFLSWAVRQYFLQARASAVKIQRVVRRRLLRQSSRSTQIPVISRKRNSVGLDTNLVQQMEELGAEIRDAKQSMQTVDRLAYFNSGTPNKSYFAPHIPPAPFVPSRRGGAERSRYLNAQENIAPTVRTSIGSIEKRVMKVHDDMARMKELIDRIQSNMSDM